MKKTLPKRTLVLGGAASGKSVWAETLVSNSNLKPIYLATGQAFDDEMRDKIAKHRDRRGPEWRLIEAPLDLGAAFTGKNDDEIILLDCATLWLTNHILAENDLDAVTAKLLGLVDGAACHVVIVTNEVGDGIVPADALSRRFREAQGRLNIALAEQMELVVRVTAGLPMALKGHLPQ